MMKKHGFWPITPPPVAVASSPLKIARSAVKGLIAPLRKPTTQQYFVKL
jgi:hypothetical protein